MDEPQAPSPFSPPKVDDHLLDGQPPPGRVGLGLLLIIVSLSMLTLALVLALDPSNEGPRYWLGVAVMFGAGATSLRSGWKMGSGQPGGYGWIAIPIGIGLMILIPNF